ncbi:hypothetical protein RM549_09300 [Salegentibacter sp. F188]|uniref:ATP synthase F0 subunit 8 n=1 Tax=Autumnicola patrickiae TaxID=3075591 RepID=A0ABU3E1V3_9FLAO|nr:hypothetical protein [Salegentibacter sp. F188]MDT0689978.1 hypothetical protein [Salegentibacter sp. F188]
MKIDFILISSALAIICFLPFILLPLFESKEEKKLKNKFKEEALRLGLNISYELSWNTNLTGIDILKKQFLFVQKSDLGFRVNHVDLSNVSQIKMVTQTVNVKQQGKLEEILSRIELEFYNCNSLAPLIVTVFDHDLNYNQDYELKNAKDLVGELQKYLNALPVLKRTA